MKLKRSLGFLFCPSLAFSFFLFYNFLYYLLCPPTPHNRVQTYMLGEPSLFWAKSFAFIFFFHSCYIGLQIVTFRNENSLWSKFVIFREKGTHMLRTTSLQGQSEEMCLTSRQQENINTVGFSISILLETNWKIRNRYFVQIIYIQI